MGILEYSVDNRIRKFRENKALTQKQLANLIGTSQQQIQRYEVGVSPVKLGTAVRICEALGAQVEDVFPATRKSLRELRAKDGADQDGKVEKVLLEAGIEIDPAVWTLKFTVHGHPVRFYGISVADKNRLNNMLWDLSKDETEQFFCFDSSECAVAINIRYLAFCQLLFDPPNISQIRDENEGKRERVRVWIGSSTEPLCFGVDSDYAEDHDETGLGPIGHFYAELDMYSSDAEQFVNFTDEDGEIAYFRAQDIALVEIDQSVLHPELEERDEESPSNSN